MVDIQRITVDVYWNIDCILYHSNVTTSLCNCGNATVFVDPESLPKQLFEHVSHYVHQDHKASLIENSSALMSLTWLLLAFGLNIKVWHL